jgi:hypothetical protein
MLGSQAQAQSGCLSFEAIAQAVLPSSTPLAATDTWGGPLYVMLGEVLQGTTSILSGNDGDETWHAHMGSGKGGVYTVGINCIAPYQPGNSTQFYSCQHTLTYEVPHAVFPMPPGKAGLMSYSGNTAKIVRGTGKFASASGNLNVRGPAIAWPVSETQFEGRWVPEISGKVCDIQ